MSFILHHLAKDIRSLRLVLSIWMILVLAEGMLLGSGFPPGVDDLRQVAIDAISSAIPLLRVVLFCIIVPLLIHEEPLVGTHAFWLTRPIPRGTLMLSKLCFLALFLMLAPLAAELAAMAVNDVTFRDMALAVPEILLGKASFVGVVLVLAVLTPNFPRFALLAASVFAAFLVLSAVLLMVPLMLQEEDATEVVGIQVGNESSSVATVSLGVGCSLVVAAHQYATRRTTRSYTLALAGAVLTGAAAFYWPWSSPRVEEPAVSKDLVPETIRVSVDTGKIWVSDAYMVRRKGEPRKNIAARMEISGIPSGYYLEPITLRPRLQFADGTRLEKARSYRAGVSPELDSSTPPELVALQQTLGETRLLNVERFASRVWPVLISVPDSVYVRYGDKEGDYSADVYLRARRYEIVSDVPLAAGGRYDRGSAHSVITNVVRHSDGCTVFLRETYVNLEFGEKARFATYYALRNDARKETLLASPEGTSYLSYASLTTALGASVEGASRRFGILYPRLRFPEQYRTVALPSVIDESWLAGARLLRIETVDAGLLRQSIRIPSFRMKPR